MDLKKGLDDINLKLKEVTVKFKHQPRNNQIAFGCIALGIFLIIIALIIW